MDLDEDLPDDWWQKIQTWFDGHWRILALGVAVIIAATVAVVIVNRLNATDLKLQRAICAEVLFLESTGPDNPRILKLAASLRAEVKCPPR